MPNRSSRPLPLSAAALALGTAACASVGTIPAPTPPAPLARYAIVPQPAHLVPAAGELALDAATRIVVSDSSLRPLGELFAAPVRASTSLPLPVVVGRGVQSDAIALVLDSSAAVPDAPEHYRLVVDEHAATLTAATGAGLFDAVQTLRQLLPAAVERRERAPSPSPADSTRTFDDPPPAPARWTIPAVAIEDAPRFRYRGVMLDVARYYYPPEFLKELVDLLALYKLNTLQLHLTDDQGWRMEIEKYPRLTTIGAWRRETQLGRHYDPYVGDGKPHGGFYTQDQLRDLVAYAAARNITIVPEIEMPGHAQAALAAYPELSCTGGPFEVSTKWEVHDEIFCPSEQTFGFLEDVLTEVMDVFPSKYIHIGGDEVPKTRWKASPLAQDIIKREGLKNEEELQSWFTRRIERFLNDHGRKMIGWDEILEGGIAPEATVMSWRGVDGGIAAARQGHDVIMTPTDHLYFDYYQGDPEQDPMAIGGYLPLDTVYAYEPIPQVLTAAEATHILGAQANLWSEYVSNGPYAEYMLLPRMLALSELTWSPKDARDYPGFLARLPAQFARLDALGVEYRVPEPLGPWGEHKVLEKKARVTLSNSLPGATIRYTVDGSVPDASSPVYTQPFEVAVSPKPAVIRARQFLPNGRRSIAARAEIARAQWMPAQPVREATQPGLAYAYAETTFSSADSVPHARFTRTGTVSHVGLRGDERPEDYGVRLTGWIDVPRDALYTFHLVCDDGGILHIDDELVIDHDGEHGATEKQGVVALRAGRHRVDLDFFQGKGGVALRLGISAPGMPEQDVPAAWLSH